MIFDRVVRRNIVISFKGDERIFHRTVKEAFLVQAKLWFWGKIVVFGYVLG